MNSLGAINSIWDWKSLHWKKEIEEISKLPLHQDNADSNFEESVKTILKWIVVTRIVISHLYPVTYVANFYSILTLCREKLLIPWLAMSAVKNFILELIVIVVVILLYLQNNLSIYLVSEFFIHKLITLAPAVYNWLTINSLYVDIKMMNRRKLAHRNTTLACRKSGAVFNHPNIIMGLPMQTIQMNYHQISNIKVRRKFSSLMNCNVLTHLGPSKIFHGLARSSSWLSIREMDFPSDNNQNKSYCEPSVSADRSTSSSCDCSFIDDNPEEHSDVVSTRKIHYVNQETTTDDFFQQNFLVQNWFLKKINHKYTLIDYVNLLKRNDELEMQNFFFDDEIDDRELCITEIDQFKSSLREKKSNECKANESKEKLEMIESSSESSASFCKQLGLSKSWIFCEMIISETINGNKKAVNRLRANTNEVKFIEVQALKAYNEKTLWKDREKSDKLMSEKRRNSNSSEMRRAIENLDWSLKSFPFPFSHSLECNSRSTLEWHNEFSALSLPIPHDNIHNTFEMLLFAFGSSDRSAVNGLDLGPPSEIYSDSEQIPNVFFEIIKTAVLRTIKHDCNCRRTADVDYGDNYWIEINV